MAGKFKLIKDFGEYNEGRVFQSYGGTMSGITSKTLEKTVDFKNKEYFSELSDNKFFELGGDEES
jgi:hypothetical protein